MGGERSGKYPGRRMQKKRVGLSVKRLEALNGNVGFFAAFTVAGSTPMRCSGASSRSEIFSKTDSFVTSPALDALNKPNKPRGAAAALPPKTPLGAFGFFASTGRNNAGGSNPPLPSPATFASDSRGGDEPPSPPSSSPGLDELVTDLCHKEPHILIRH